MSERTLEELRALLPQEPQQAITPPIPKPEPLKIYPLTAEQRMEKWLQDIEARLRLLEEGRRDS